jgi:hypothetical protein
LQAQHLARNARLSIKQKQSFVEGKIQKQVFRFVVDIKTPIIWYFLDVVQRWLIK